MSELDTLHALGYRGHVDIVDDNFIGNRSAAKVLLPKLRTWQEEHNWPFEFSTEASINLANDEDLLKAMKSVGFSALFVGIESPDTVTLKAMQKQQNTSRPIPESIKKIISHGILVNAGYIVGFDSERGSVAPGTLKNIEETLIPVNMVGLLYALPTTQLSRRLEKEGRLHKDFEVSPDDVACQTVSGLNFDTIRPKSNILEDFKEIVDKSYEPASYFGRVKRCSLLMDCSEKKLKLPLKQQIRDLKGFAKLVWQMGIKASYRRHFWDVFFTILLKNPKAIRYAIAPMALYLHFGPFKNYILASIDREISQVRNEVHRPALLPPTMVATPAMA